MNDQPTMNNRPGHLDPFYEQLKQAYETIAQCDQPPIAKLGLFATRSLQLFEKHQQRFREDPGRMFHVITNNDEFWLTFSTRLFAETLNDAIYVGKIRSVDTQKAATLLLNAIFALMIRRIHLAPTDTIEDDVRDLIDLYLNGLTADRIPTPVDPAARSAG